MQWNAVNLAALDQVEFEGLVPHYLISLCRLCPDEPWLQCTCVALYYKYIQILHASCPTDVGIPRNVCVYTSVFLGLRCHGVIPLPYTEAATLSIMYPITIQSPSLDHNNCVVIVLHHVARCCNFASNTAVFRFLSLTTPHHIHIHGGVVGPLVRLN